MSDLHGENNQPIKGKKTMDMKCYKVRIKEVFYSDVYVLAPSEGEARKYAENQLENGTIDPVRDDDNFDREIEIEEAPEQAGNPNLAEWDD